MIPITSDSRVFVTGKTGSGKTHFTKTILWNMYHAKVYHDVKHEELTKDSLLLTRNDTYQAHGIQELIGLLNKGITSIVYLPPMGLDDSRDQDDFNRLCEVLYKRGNICLFVDEVTAVCNQHQMTTFHKEIMVRGRTRNVGIVNLSQRPKEIPNNIITESEHQFIFKLSLDSDIIKLKGIIPKKYHEQMYNLKLYHFIYNNVYGSTGIHLPVRV